MLKSGISIASCLLGALCCCFTAACSGGGGKASLSVVGMSGTLTLIAQSSVEPPSDIGAAYRSRLVATGPAR